jgi:hypothetical protein
MSTFNRQLFGAAAAAGPRTGQDFVPAIVETVMA